MSRVWWRRAADDYGDDADSIQVVGSRSYTDKLPSFMQVEGLISYCKSNVS